MKRASKTALKATWLATQIAGRVSSRLGGLFASRLWFTPWPVPISDRARTRQAAWLEGAEPVMFRSRIGPIAGFAVGRGPVILLVHGWGERAAFLGAFVSPLVSSGFRVVGVDLPAHGNTRGTQTDLYESADVVIDVAWETGASGVVAHSMGGTVTSIAISKGLSVDSAVLISPASDPNNVLERFASMLSIPPRAVAGLRNRIQGRFGSDIWDRLLLKELVGTFQTPVLIVHDLQDRQIDVADSDALAAAWPGARTLITSGLGHDRIMRDPEVIAAATDFLRNTVEATDKASA